jgi:hypothetical protein
LRTRKSGEKTTRVLKETKSEALAQEVGGQEALRSQRLRGSLQTTASLPNYPEVKQIDSSRKRSGSREGECDGCEQPPHQSEQKGRFRKKDVPNVGETWRTPMVARGTERPNSQG